MQFTEKASLPEIDRTRPFFKTWNIHKQQPTCFIEYSIGLICKPGQFSGKPFESGEAGQNYTQNL